MNALQSSTRNALGNAKNSFQGEARRVLCVRPGRPGSTESGGEAMTIQPESHIKGVTYIKREQQ